MANMKLAALSSCLWVLGMGFMATTAHAEQADRNAPLTVEADAMQYNDKAKTTTFTGRVVGSKGSMQLRASHVVIQQFASGNYRTTVTGDSKQQAYMRQKREGMNEFIEGQANSIVRDDHSQSMQLSGNARMRRLAGSTPMDEIIADTIVYNEATETYSARGGASTAGSAARGGVPAGRVRVTLTPSTKTTSSTSKRPASTGALGGLRQSATIGGR